ncbi:MAG: hypothetical protein WC426_00315 [Sulfuriferula sp.]
MKRLLFSVLMSAAMITPSLAADVGVSVSVGQPGFYGQINIGNYPAPQLIYRQPIIVERVSVSRPPIYLHVPPGHAKHWSKHCHEYNACGQRVYFVQDNWYNQVYVPHYQKSHNKGKDNYRNQNDHGNKPDKGNGNKKGHDNGHGQGN